MAEPGRSTRLGLVTGLTLVAAVVVALVFRGGAVIIGFAVLFLVFVPLERLFALRPQRVFRQNYLTDLTHFFVNNLFVTVGAIVLVVVAALPLIWLRALDVEARFPAAVTNTLFTKKCVRSVK